MTRYVLDTDTYSLYLRDHMPVSLAVIRHLSDKVILSIITVEELWSGWAKAITSAKTPDQKAVGYARLTDTINSLKNWPVVPFPAAAIRRHAALKKLKLNVGSNDLKIAAIALELGGTVVTHNTRDFSRVPGLQIEDWVGA